MLKITTVRHLGINGTLQTHILENYVNGYVELSNYPNDRKASDSMGGGQKRRRKKERKKKEYDYLFTYGMCPSHTVFLQQ
jgi:hypothetical protein